MSRSREAVISVLIIGLAGKHGEAVSMVVLVEANKHCHLDGVRLS